MAASKAQAKNEVTYRVVSPVRVDGTLYRDGEITVDPAKLAGCEHCVTTVADDSEAAPDGEQ